MTKPLAKWQLLVSLFFAPAFLQAQADWPSPDDFVYVEQEPRALNLAEVRQAIGYPEAAAKAGLEGAVVVRILVDESGNYLYHKILRSSDSLFLTAVERHVSKLKFSPGATAEKPVKVWVNVPFNFKLVGNPEETARTLIAELGVLIAKEPANHELYLKRGVQYLNLSLPDSAEADFRASLKFNPRKKGKKKNSFANVFFAEFGLGSALSGQEKWALATDAFSSALAAMASLATKDSAVEATVSNVYVERGFARANLSLWDEAEKDYLMAIEANPNLACAVYSLLQDVGISSSNNKTILRALDGLIECQPEDNLLLYSRGYYLSLEEDYPGALRDLRACLEKTTYPQIKIACHNRLAWVYTRTLQFDPAQVELDASIKLNALNPQSYYYLGLLDLARGKKDQACKNLNRSVSFDLSGPELEACEKLIADTCQ